MNEYIFVLGRDRGLSLLEVFSFLKARNIKYSVLDQFEDLLILEMDDLNFSSILNKFGGVIKIMKKTSMDNLYDGTKNKIFYTLTDYDDSDELYDQLKKYFKQEKIKALMKKEFVPSLKVDLDLIYFDGKLYKAIAILNPKEYKLRDEARPHFDAKSVISIRLAKIMVNLGMLKEGDKLLDPFCGLGTILQEASLMGIKAYGSDNDFLMVRKSKENLKGYKNVEVHELDSKKLETKFNDIDGIVTEPHMGPYYTKRVSLVEANKLKAELDKLYFETLVSCKKVLKRNGRVVMIIPVIKSVQGNIDLDINTIIEKAGFVVEQLDPGISIPYYYSKGKLLDRWIYILKLK